MSGKKEHNRIILFAMCFNSLALAAQPVGIIRGVVTDGASGQALPYVSVVILHSNPPIAASTDSTGHFRLNNLPVH